jgi:hypothetical protein
MRPKTVTITTWFMAVLNFFGYATLWDVQQKPTSYVMGVFIGSTLVIAVGSTVLWFHYHGKNWARLLVLLTSVVILINNALAFRSANPIVKVVDVVESAVAVFLLVWLNTPAARRYFKQSSPVDGCP